MAQTPILGVRAMSSVPTTADAIGTDPGTTGIPGDPTDVEAALAAMQGEIDGLSPGLTVTDGVVTISPATTATVPLGGVTDLTGGNAGLNFLTNVNGGLPVVVTDSAVTGSYAIDCAAGLWFDLTLTGNTTFTITNAPATGEIFVILRQGGAGSKTATWPASVKWQAADGTNTGTAPTLHTAVGAVNIISLSTADTGTTWGAADEASGGSSLTVNDEGTPLATAATSIDFVGAGVTASGATAAKTVTIPGTTTADIQAASPPHAHVAYETHTSDGSTVTFTLDQTYEPGSVMAWNRTTGTMPGVTEVLPDQVTLSVAGTAADLLDFHYAASMI